MGLLKVAEQLINPFGDDDEDFELNWLIDRHVKVTFVLMIQMGCFMAFSLYFLLIKIYITLSYLYALTWITF